MGEWKWYTMLYADARGKFKQACCLSNSYDEASINLEQYLSKGDRFLAILPRKVQLSLGRGDFRFREKNILRVCKHLIKETSHNVDKQLDTELSIMYDNKKKKFYICPIADTAKLVEKGEYVYHIYRQGYKEGKDNLTIKYFKENIFAVPYITPFPYNKREVKLIRRRNLEMVYRLNQKNIDEVCRGIAMETNLNVEKGLYTQFSVMYDIKKESFYYCDTIDTHVYSKTGDPLYFSYHWEPQYGTITSPYLEEMIFNI